MSDGNGRSDSVAPRGADLLTLGFGTTVAMWALGYLLWLPGFRNPAVAGILLLVVLAAGGRAAAELTGGGWRRGLSVGLLAATLNLLVLGSLLKSEPQRSLPSVAIWLPGWLLLGAILGALGGAYGSAIARSRLRREPAGPLQPDWTAAFCAVAAGATLCLLAIGGIVTGSASGLAVTDWPNSFGSNMFLFPLSRMTGGIYFEHAHRLFGSLVGLTTLVLAVHLQRAEPRRAVRIGGWTAFALVVVQGILGGLRVTGRFTLSDSPAGTAPSTTLGIVHGVVGQIVFGLLAALTVVTSRNWRAGSATAAPPRPSAMDLSLGRIFMVALVVQLVIGTILRHLASGLLVHIAFAVIVTILGLTVGVRAWGLYPPRTPVNRCGRLIIGLVALQVALGIFAVAIAGSRLAQPNPPLRDIVFTTLHQVNGAVLLAVAVGLLLWLERLQSAAAVFVASTVTPPQSRADHPAAV